MSTRMPQLPADGEAGADYRYVLYRREEVMNVRELIKKLKKFDSNLSVACGDNEMGEYEISEVKLDRVTFGNTQYFNVDVEVQDDIVMLS